MDVYEFTDNDEQNIDPNSTSSSEFEGFDDNDIETAQQRLLDQGFSSGSDLSESDFSDIEDEIDEGSFKYYHENRPQWRDRNFSEIDIPPFLMTSGARLPPGFPQNAKPSDYFKLFFTERIVEDIVQFTNIYAQEATNRKRRTNRNYIDKHWSVNMSVPEMKAYFGVLLILSINNCSQLRLVFSKDKFVGNEGIRSVFTLKRFQKINSYFSLYDKSVEPPRDSDQYDKGLKVKYLVDNLNKSFPKYFQHSAYVAIDESLEPCRSRVDFVQYCPAKPIRRGIKFFCLNDSETRDSYYCLKFELYLGKKWTTASPKGFYYDLCNRLTSYLRGRNVQLFTDNLYTSVPMALDFMRNRIYCTGTIRKNKKAFLPPVVIEPPKMKRGEFKLFQATNYPNLTACVWQDTKEVRFISVGANPLVRDIRVARNASRNNLMVNQPFIAKLYGDHMSAVDKMNVYKNVYDFGRRSRRWPMYVFFWCFQVAVSNSFKLYKLTQRGLRKTYCIIDFRIDLAKELIGNYSYRKRELANVNIEPKHQLTRLECRRPKVCRHHKNFFGTSRRTVFGCKGCGLHMCEQCYPRAHPN